MKDNLQNIPELNLDKTEHFYVVGTKNRDGIIAGNYKADLKKGIGDSGALINTISGMSESEKAALREALGVGGDTPTGPDFNGHEYVDLGLPSGTLWATMNVGANSPEELGSYFPYGEIVAKTPEECTAQSYRFAGGEYGADYTKYNSSDNKTVLDIEDDAARANMGGDWRIPTLDEYDELVSHTTYSFTTVNGIQGGLFTGSNGNSIFIPSGDGIEEPYYMRTGRLADTMPWSDYDAPGWNYIYSFEDWGATNTTDDVRWTGYPVRGIIKPEAEPTGDDTIGKILVVSANSLGGEGLSDEQITAAGVDIDTFMAGRYIALKVLLENDTYSLYPLASMYLDGPDEVIARFGESMVLEKRSSGWYLRSTEGGEGNTT